MIVLKNVVMLNVIMLSVVAPVQGPTCPNEVRRNILAGESTASFDEQAGIILIKAL
jgi:hypothetical protein